MKREIAFCLTILWGVFLVGETCIASADKTDAVTEQPSPTAPRPSPSVNAGSPHRSRQILEISIPETFRGCWQGEVLHVDSLRGLNGWPSLAFWHPKSFELCFVQRGRDRWELTYSAAQLDTAPSPDLQQVSDSFRVLPGSTADSIVVESKMRFRDTLSVKDETTTIKLRVADKVMKSQAVVIADLNGTPWMESTWHTDFHPVPESRHADEGASTP